MDVAAAEDPFMALATAFPPNLETALAATDPVPPLALATASPDSPVAPFFSEAERGQKMVWLQEIRDLFVGRALTTLGRSGDCGDI